MPNRVSRTTKSRQPSQRQTAQNNTIDKPLARVVCDTWFSLERSPTMKTRLTPLHLKLLLHAYSHPEPWPHNGGCATEYEQHLATAGLVQLHKDGTYYECTEMGKAHVDQICALQFPTQAWVAATGELIRCDWLNAKGESQTPAE